MNRRRLLAMIGLLPVISKTKLLGSVIPAPEPESISSNDGTAAKLFWRGSVVMPAGEEVILKMNPPKFYYRIDSIQATAFYRRNVRIVVPYFVTMRSSEITHLNMAGDALYLLNIKKNSDVEFFLKSHAPIDVVVDRMAIYQ